MTVIIVINSTRSQPLRSFRKQKQKSRISPTPTKTEFLPPLLLFCASHGDKLKKLPRPKKIMETIDRQTAEQQMMMMTVIGNLPLPNRSLLFEERHSDFYHIEPSVCSCPFFSSTPKEELKIELIGHHSKNENRKMYQTHFISCKSSILFFDRSANSRIVI